MDDTERRITVFHALHDNPDRKNIIDLIQRLVLVYHLFIDAEEMFHTAVYLGFDARIVHMFLDFIHNLMDKRLPGVLTECQFFGQFFVNLRLEIFERQIIQLGLDLGNTETISNRRVDIHRFTRLFFLFFRLHILKRPHIVQTVCQLNQDNPDVLRHR